MTDWKDDKDLGPWPFVKQHDKWGYLNTKRWSNIQEAVDFSISKGLPIDPTHIHVPCGHWHQPPGAPLVNLGSHWWYQPSNDVFHEQIVLAPMYWDGGPESGFVLFAYNKATQTWQSWEVIDGITMYAEPHTVRISNLGYIAFYVYCWPYTIGWGDNARLYVFNPDGTHFYTDVWPGDHDTGIPYETDDIGWDYNTMDCYNNDIVCLAEVWQKNGVPYTGLIDAKMSHDGGRTFPDEFNFPKINQYDRAMVRVTEDGTFWVIIKSSQIFQLWKSNTGVTSFSKVYEYNFNSDIGNHTAHAGFDLSDADGEYVTISLVSTSLRKWRIYQSSNHGVSFTMRNLDSYMTNYNPSIYKMVSSGQYVVIMASYYPSGNSVPILRSTDYGVTFTELYNPSILYYTDIQRHENEIVITDCAATYGEGLHQGMLYSDDYGATWTLITSPAPVYTVPGDVLVPGVGMSIEPQVWALP